MKFLMTVLMAALFSFGASYAQACGVDAVSGKTDTTITISWDLSACKQVNSGEKFEICWKESGNFGAACNPPRIRTNTMTGSTTIEGLKPSTAYKIKTNWHRKSAWYDVMTRIVTTNPSPPPSTEVGLRYEKNFANCVDFYWKNKPFLPPNQDATLALHVKSRFLGPIGGYFTVDYDSQKHDLSSAAFNSTGEYTKQVCGFSVSRRYQAYIYWRSSDNVSAPGAGQSNTVEWK